MKRIIWIPVLTLIALAGLRGQPQQGGTVTGRVLSRENNEPLQGANVTLEGSVLGASSGAGGDFLLRNIPPGRHSLQVSMIGYRAKRVSDFSVISGDTSVFTFELEPAPVEAEPVVVTAARREQLLTEVPASVSVVGEASLEYRNSVTVDDALRYVPGVHMTQTQVDIRGSAGYSFGVGTRVLILVDGIPLITGDTGEINWESIPVSQIERIEVVKGAASALYGSSALGGVINIITRSPGEHPETRLRVYGGLYDLPKYRSWQWTGDSRTLSGIQAGYRGKSGDLSLSASIDRTLNDGYRQNDYWKRWNGTLRLGYDISPYQAAGLFFSILEQRRGSFLYWRDFEHAFEPPADELRQSVYSVRWNLGGSYREFVSDRLFYSARFSWFKSRWSDNVPSQYDSAGSNSRSDVVNGEIQANAQLTARQTLVGGLSGNLQSVDADTIFGRHNGHGAAAYLQDEILLDEPLRLTLGGRFDYQSIEGLDAVSQFNPKVGLVYSLPDSTAIRFSGGRGFRAPTVAEIFTTSTAGGVAIHPNPGLQPERSWSADLGASHPFGGNVEADFSLFRNEFWDLIEPGFGADGVVHFENITRALIYGVELTLNASFPTSAITHQLSYTYMDPRDVTSGDVLKYRPRNLFYYSVHARVAPFSFGADARFLSRIDRIDDSFVTLGIIPGGDERVPIYVVDVRAGADWTMGGLPVTAVLQVNNLLQYYYVELIGNVAPTRNVVLTLETRI
jgi:iron complex outermembrane receptor protein